MKQKRQIVIFAAITLVAITGGYFITQSFAATSSASVEAESGMISGNASAAGTAVGASGSRRVAFGGGPSGPTALGKRISFGAFTVSGAGTGDDWTPADITSLESRIGHKVTPVQYFSDFDTDFRLTDCQTLAGGGRGMLVAWEPQVVTQNIINGASDAYIKKFAADTAKCSGQVAIRLYPEMNGSFTIYSPYHDRDYPGDTSTHTTSVAQLVSAYQHIVTTFRSVNPNVKFVFSPNQTDDPVAANNKLESYYPGNAYTDILAFDAYNWGNGGPFGSWQSAHDVYAEVYGRVTALNASSPVWVTETSSKEPLVNDGYGLNPGKSKGTWITDLFNDTAFPRMAAIVWFDINKQSSPPQGGERDWRVNSSADALNALKQSLTMTP